MNAIRVLVAALLCCSAAAHAASDGFAPRLDALDAVPRFTTDGAAVAKALATTRSTKSQPLQYAVAADLPLTMADGRWDEADAGTLRWRLRVASAGAKNLSVEFARFQLPKGATLYVYDTAGALVQGPYTAANNPADGRLWTAMIDGSEAVIEARVPRAAQDALQLSVAGVMHGFLDFQQAASGAQPKSLSGDPAGSCEINVICTQGNNWRNEIRSVAAYTIRHGNSGVICSGQMVNDVPQDGAPFFLTANHCEVDSQSVAASMVVYWNYQASACSGTDGPTDQTQTGSILFAGDVGSDFTLVRLSQLPPSGYNVYYAGFDASGTGASSGVGIHHPAGDIKKISTFNTAAAQDQLTLEGTTRTVQAWRVTWASGVTEGGSSGSGLWNQNHQIIGVLSGGGSSCSTATDPDYYGRLNVAWTAGSSACGQLKASLDPANSGSRTTTGANASSLAGALPAAPSCAGAGSGTVSGNLGGGGGAVPPVLLSLLLGGAMLRRRRD